MKAVLRVLVVILIVGTLVRIFLVDSFYVSGDSMAPTIADGDYVFVNKYAYWRGDPVRGDVVVSHLPGHPFQHLIKRVIALPGERIKIEKNHVFLKKDRTDEWVLLPENYIDFPEDPKNLIQDVGITYLNLDPREYFAMGDNRMISVDSREIGPLNRWDIKGRVFLTFSLKKGIKIIN